MVSLAGAAPQFSGCGAHFQGLGLQEDLGEPLPLLGQGVHGDGGLGLQTLLCRALKPARLCMTDF